MQSFFLSLLINVWYVHCFIFVVYSYLVYLWHHLSHSLLLPKLRWIRCWSKLVKPQTRQKTNNPPVLYPCSTDTPWHKAGQLSYYRTLKQTTVHSNRHSKSLLSKVFPVIFYPNYILFTLFESFALCFFIFGIAYLLQEPAGLGGNWAVSTFKPANTEITWKL